MGKRISIIIPTHHRGEILDECIRSVLDSISSDDQVLVINDYKKTILVDTWNDSRLTILDNPKSGAASARNFGASKAKAPVLLFIDDDMLINRSAIESCYELLHEIPDSVVMADWIFNPAEMESMKRSLFGRYMISIGRTSLRGWAKGVEWSENSFFQNRGITSQFLMIPSTYFHDLGGYDEAFPYAGFEDYDMARKMNKRNHRLLVNTRCLVYHNEKDRISLAAFLERQRRGASSRKKAVQLGYSELAIPISWLKRTYYRILLFAEPLIRFLIGVIPNKTVFDTVYAFFVQRLLGTVFYRGYK